MVLLLSLALFCVMEPVRIETLESLPSLHCLSRLALAGSGPYPAIPSGLGGCLTEFVEFQVRNIDQIISSHVKDLGRLQSDTQRLEDR